MFSADLLQSNAKASIGRDRTIITNRTRSLNESLGRAISHTYYEAYEAGPSWECERRGSKHAEKQLLLIFFFAFYLHNVLRHKGLQDGKWR